MKHFYSHKLAILPLLGILAMSPSDMTSKFASRGIASVQEEVKTEVKKEESKTPKYDALVSKVDPKSIMKDIDNNFEKFKAKREDLIGKVKKEREDFKKDQSDKEVIKVQHERAESLVISMILTEASLKDLQEKKGIEQADDEASQKLLAEQKAVIESILVDLDANDVLLAKASEPKKEEPKVEEPKKEEPKVAEEKKDEKKEEAKKEEKKEEVKVAEEKKEEKKEQTPAEKQLCDLQEQNKVLTKQLEQLVADQKQMMNAFMGMAQMMVGMYQQQQQQAPNPYFQNGPGWNSSPYQYNQPQTAGNWVYYPQGFQPQQQNIFAQPQLNAGIYPDQFHMQQQVPSFGQQQQQWGLQPQMNFGMQQQQGQGYNDPRYNQYQQFTPGSFGNDAFSFNMQPQMPSPMLTMR